MTLKTAISYRRVSTKEQEQDGTSLQSQLEDIQRYAEKNGLKLVADFSDDASGMTLYRSGIADAMAMLAEGNAGVFIAYDSDRVSRNPRDYLHFREQLVEWDVELHYSQRGKVDLTSFGGRVIESIQGEFALEWRRKLLTLTREGKREKAKEGKVVVAQRPPYGYRLENGYLVIHEDEARIIRLIFQLYTQDGYSLSDIAQYLTQQRIPSHADIHAKMSHPKRWHRGFWAHTSVKQIIKNETYAGVWHWGKGRQETYRQDGKRKVKYIPNPKELWIAIEVPAIIDRPTWEKAQTKLATNQRDASRNTRHQYLLAKRLTCGVCGLRMYADFKQKMYYYCPSHARTKFPGYQWCDLPYFRGDLLEEDIWRSVKEMLSNSERLTQLIEKAVESSGQELGDLEHELERVQREINNRERAIKRLLMAFANEEDDSDIQETRTELKEQLNLLRQQEIDLKAKLSQAEARRDTTLEFSKMFFNFQTGFTLESEPFEVKSEWIKALDVRATLRVENGQRKADVTCIWDKWTVNIEDISAWKYVHNLQLAYTITLSQV
jgi:site-specific DNA recombinase